MATISPIQIALRDLGTGIGGTLEREAERRRMALQAQQQQNQLTLQQAQLANEARLNEGKLGVSLAEVGLQGRKFEAEQEQKRAELASLEQSRRDTAQYYENQYQFGRMGQILGQPEQAARAEFNTQQAEALRQQNAVRIPVDAAEHLLTQTLTQKYGPDEAQAKLSRTKNWADTLFPIGSLPIDEQTGKPYFTGAQIATLANLEKLRDKKATMTPQERQAAIEHNVKLIQADPTAKDLPYESILAIASAGIDNPDAFYAAGRKRVDDAAVLRQKAIAERAAQKTKEAYWGTVTPAMVEADKAEMEKIDKTVVNPMMQRWRAQDAFAIHGARGQGTTTPGASPDRAILEQKAAGAASKYGLSPAEVQAVPDVESSWNPKSVNKQYGPTSGQGLMGIIPSTFARYGPAGADVFNPDANLDAGAKLLAELKQQYGGDLRRAYAAYNAGPGNIPKTGSIPTTVTVQGPNGPVTVHPAAYADKALAAMQKRGGQYQPPTVTPPVSQQQTYALPGGRMVVRRPQAGASNASVVTLPGGRTAYTNPTLVTRARMPAGVPVSAPIALPAAVTPPTATSTPEQDAAYRAANAQRSGAVQPSLAAGAIPSPANVPLDEQTQMVLYRELQRQYPNDLLFEDGWRAVRLGNGVYIVEMRHGQIVNVQSGQ